MLRPILIILFFITLPYIAYWGYIYWQQRHQESRNLLDNTPWLTLCVLAGIGTILGVYIAFVHNIGDRDNSYVPAQMQNGEIVPGTFKEGTQN